MSAAICWVFFKAVKNEFLRKNSGFWSVYVASIAIAALKGPELFIENCHGILHNQMQEFASSNGLMF
jgi:hypothetical protein